MTDGPRSYGSPGAFRTALTERLKTKAQTDRWTLPQLQRQIAYDRLLERLYLVDDGWIVKGATALLARDIGVRATVDIDVYRAAARDVAEADLREADISSASFASMCRITTSIGPTTRSDSRRRFAWRPFRPRRCLWALSAVTSSAD